MSGYGGFRERFWGLNEERIRRIFGLWEARNRARLCHYWHRLCQPSVKKGLVWYNVARSCHFRHRPSQATGRSRLSFFSFFLNHSWTITYKTT